MASGAGFAARVDIHAGMVYYARLGWRRGLGFHSLVSVFFLGNVMTLAFVWGCVQFHRHDYKAPWVAYAAFVFPLLYAMAGIYLIEGLPPQFDAIALR